MDQVPRNNRWMDFEGLSYGGYTPNWGYPIQPRPTGTDLKVDHEGGSWSTTQSKGPYVPLPQVTSQPLNGATWDLRLVKCWCRFKQLGCKAGLCGLVLEYGPSPLLSPVHLLAWLPFPTLKCSPQYPGLASSVCHKCTPAWQGYDVRRPVLAFVPPSPTPEYLWTCFTAHSQNSSSPKGFAPAEHLGLLS